MFLYIRMFLVMFVSFYTSRVVLYQLGADDFGLYNVVGSLIMMFTFIQGSLSSSASRFLSFYIGKGNSIVLRQTFCMIMNIHIIFSLFILVFAETIGLWYFNNYMVIPTDRYIAAYIVYQLSNISAVLAILIVPYRAMIIAQEKMKAFAYLSIIEVLSKLGIAIIISVSSYDKLIIYGTLLFLLQISLNLVYLFFCKKTILESKFFIYWNKTQFKEMLSFSGWSLCSYSPVVVNQAYNLMINLFFGPAVNAARAVSYQVQNNISMFVSNFQVALNPQIIKMFAVKDYKRLQELVLMSSKISFCLLLVILLPLMVNLNFVLNLWLVHVPDKTESLIMVIGMISILSSFCNPLGVVAEAANRLKLYNTITMPYYLLLIPLSYLCLKIGGSVISIFIIYLFFEFCSFFLKIFLIKKITGLSMKHECLLYLRCIFVLSCSVIICCVLLTFFQSNVYYFLLKSFLAITFSSLFIYFIILNKKERIYCFKNVLSRIRIFR